MKNRDVKMREPQYIDNFNPARARIKIELNIISRRIELFIISCNIAFKKLTSLDEDDCRDIADRAFGSRKGDYIRKLLLNEIHERASEHLMHFDSCRKVLIVRNEILGNGFQDILCIDASEADIKRKHQQEIRPD